MSATDRDENLNGDTPLPSGHPAEGSPVVSAGEVLSGEGMAQPEVSSGSSDVGGS